MFGLIAKCAGSSSRAFKRIDHNSLGILCKDSCQLSRKKIVLCTTIRLNSTLQTDDDPSLLSSVQEIASISEPSFSSLGLGGFSPKGLVECALETLHTGLDIPWWSSIVIGTVIVRIAMFPLVIIAQRNAANLNNHMPTLQRLQQKMVEARTSRDPNQVLEASHKMTEFMKVNKVNPLKNMLVPIAQIPVFLSVFTAVNEMTGLPVESLKTGGLSWFTDLTVPDPFYALPLMTVITLAATIEAGVDGIKANQVGSSTIKMILRSMPLITFPFIINFPSAMLCYWLTSNTFSLVQVLFLRIPQVRNYFSIPELVDHTSAYPTKDTQHPKQTFMEGLRESMRNMEIAREIQERERLEALKMKEPSKKKEESCAISREKP